MNLLSSDLRQRPAWTEVVSQLLHQPGAQWQETELRYNDITLMVPSGNSYQVLRLLLYSAVDVGRARTMQWIGGLYDFCRSDRSDDASQAKIVYALETDEEGKERGMEGFMKLQIGLLSTRNPPLSSIPILSISHPSDLPSLLSSLQQPPPSSTRLPAHNPIPPTTHAHHHPNIYHHPRPPYITTSIPSRDTLLPLCTVPTATHRNRSRSYILFQPLSPQSCAILSGPIFRNFPGLRDLLELVETPEGKEQIRNAMALASGGSELVEVEVERFLAFWEHEFAV
ncbi:hypothetical protein QR685DRAFT_430649 [Neurospora intermedia]|uniref:HNH nuclease domain-containing protein n=1 Tax=Neurospora intermedia TaxID=5142 RepID=A0ABR3DST8_NEUIN